MTQLRDTQLHKRRISSVMRAEVLALVALLICGAGYRALASRYARPAESTPIPKGSLSRISLRIGDWEGHDVPLSEYIVRATQTDDHINRLYSSPRGGQVWLFVAYGVRLRDLMPHRPEVCYPGSGWTFRSTREGEASSSAGPLRFQVHQFAKAGLESQQVTVLNYYIVDGQTSPDVSLLRFRAAKLSNNPSYAVQVQIAAFGVQPPQEEDSAVRFAAAAAPQISQVVENAVQLSSPAHQARNN